MMRMCILALLLQGNDLPRLIARLSDDDVAVRTRAETEILSHGMKAAPDLRTLLADRDSEVAARARAILDKIGSPKILLGDGSTTPFPKDKAVPLTILIDNPWGEEAVYSLGHFTLVITVLELKEKPPQDAWEPAIFFPEASAGRCLLSASDFQKVATGGTWRRRFTDLRQEESFRIAYSEKILEAYPRISMARPTLAGRYGVTVRYSYDAAAYKRTCAGNCEGHDDPAAPWNRAWTGPLEASAEFTLR